MGVIIAGCAVVLTATWFRFVGRIERAIREADKR